MHPWGSFPEAPRSFPARLPRSFPEAFQKLPQGLSITLGLAPPKALWKLPSRFQNLPDVWGTFQKLLLSFQEAPKGFPKASRCPRWLPQTFYNLPRSFQNFPNTSPTLPHILPGAPRGVQKFRTFPTGLQFRFWEAVGSLRSCFFFIWPLLLCGHVRHQTFSLKIFKSIDAFSAKVVLCIFG